MPAPARVQSIEALDAFRATLLVYLEKAGRILEEAQSDVVRTRMWLETDCRLNWKRQIRDRSKIVAQAQAELLTAKLSGHPEAIQDRRMALAKAQRALEDVEARLARVERWLRQFEPEVHAHTQAVSRLQQVFGHDMRKALTFLETAVTTLSDYADLAPEPPPPSHHPPPPTHPPPSALPNPPSATRNPHSP